MRGCAPPVHTDDKTWGRQGKHSLKLLEPSRMVTVAFGPAQESTFRLREPNLLAPWAPIQG